MEEKEEQIIEESEESENLEGLSNSEEAIGTSSKDSAEKVSTSSKDSVEKVSTSSKDDVSHEEKQERKLMIPGEIIVSGDDYLPGDFTRKEGDNIIANRYGLSDVKGRVVKIIPKKVC